MKIPKAKVKYNINNNFAAIVIASMAQWQRATLVMWRFLVRLQMEAYCFIFSSTLYLRVLLVIDRAVVIRSG